MRLIDIYNIAVRKGLENDPRTRREIKEELDRAKREFRKLGAVEKKIYDRERLKHPYVDTRILNGDPRKEIRTVIVGIDMEGPEILTADRLNERGESIDLVMAHHPEGAAWASFYDVMTVQISLLKQLGVAEEVAKALLKERMGEVQRAVSPANHFRSVDIARLLGLAYICIHTPADNQVTHYLQRLFDKKRPATLSQVVNILKGIPEYRDGMKKNAGPRILIGEPGKKAGKVFVDMTGGTEGSKKVFGRLSQAGVGTIVSMHLSEEHFKSAKDEHINIVIAGHIASDTLGVNLILDEMEKRAELKIIPCSGFLRVRR